MGAHNRQYEFIDHTADIIVRGWGATLDDAFAAVAEGMFAVITDSATLNGTASITREVRSIDREGLLVSFLSELIVIHETENTVLSYFEVTLLDETKLTFSARSEVFDAARHGRGTPVKGISYHLMEIGVDPENNCPYVQVLLDI